MIPSAAYCGMTIVWTWSEIMLLIITIASPGVEISGT